MNIIPKDQTIHTLLLNPTEKLLIPSYQRRYAWGFNQTYALFEDIDMLQPDDGHLFGMLILHTGLHHGGINTIDVVDGQQRLTTISLLLVALRDHFEILDNSYNVQQINSLLKCGNDQNSRENKLVLGALDNKDFVKLLDGKTEGIINKKLLEAYTSFKRLIENSVAEEGQEWITGFYQKLVHTAKIIRLDVQQAKDAYKLFETINNRGLRLSATDILKNFILGHAAKISDTKLEEAKELWSDLIIQLDGIPSDDFFRQYISSIYTRKITKSKLIEEFKNYYFKLVKEVDKLGEYTYNQGYYEESFEDETDDPESIDEESIPNKVDKSSNDRIDLTEFLTEIVNAATCYSKIWYQKFDNNKLNVKLKDLSDIKSFPTFIYLMHYLQWSNDIKDQLKIINLVTALMLRRHICSKRTSENDDIFSKLLRIERNENYYENVKEAILEHYPDDDDFLDRFPTHELKGTLMPRAKYILTQVEYHLTGNTGELSVNSGNDVHLEHIIPQKITPNNWKNKFGDWETYLGDKAAIKHRKFVNRIGNMTLLAGDLNISASNNPFTRKKTCYRKSNISMTKELGESNRDFKFYHLEKRGNELAELAIVIWKI